MTSSPGYRPHVARAYARLYRPFPPGGRRRSRFDQRMARWWTRLDVAAYRHLGVSLGVKALGVNDVILLRTRGRRTGQVREVLVAYVDLGGVPIVCGGNAGSDRPPGWFENLRDGGPAEVEYRGHQHSGSPGDPRRRRSRAGLRRRPSRLSPHLSLPHPDNETVPRGAP